MINLFRILFALKFDTPRFPVSIGFKLFLGLSFLQVLQASLSCDWKQSQTSLFITEQRPWWNQYPSRSVKYSNLQFPVNFKIWYILDQPIQANPDDSWLTDFFGNFFQYPIPGFSTQSALNSNIFIRYERRFAVISCLGAPTRLTVMPCTLSINVPLEKVSGKSPETSPETLPIWIWNDFIIWTYIRPIYTCWINIVWSPCMNTKYM